MGYSLELKGPVTYGIFIILTAATVSGTTSNESLASGLDGVTSSYDWKYIDGRSVGAITCNSTVECQINGPNSVCVLRIDGHGIYQCAKLYRSRSHNNTYRYRYCGSIKDVRKMMENCRKTDGQSKASYTHCVLENKELDCQCGNDYEEILTHPYASSYNCIPIKGVRDMHLGETCNFTVQCVNPFAECDHMENVCVCRAGYELVWEYNVSSCNYKTGKQRVDKSQEIYKAAMVALACFLLAILGIFLLFIWNRSIQNRRLRQSAYLDNSHDDIFSICDQLAIERLKDKPPTYEDVALSDQQVVGMPPPIYSANEDESLPTLSNRTGPFPSTSTAAGHHNQAFVSDA